MVSQWEQRNACILEKDLEYIDLTLLEGLYAINMHAILTKKVNVFRPFYVEKEMAHAQCTVLIKENFAKPIQELYSVMGSS